VPAAFDRESTNQDTQDVLWSAQDDKQLVGRLGRRGQQAQAFVYRLILDDTLDVFLNNVSFAKSAMLTGFLTENKSSPLSKCTSPHLLCIANVPTEDVLQIMTEGAIPALEELIEGVEEDQPSEDEEMDDPPKGKAKAKAKAKPKAKPKPRAKAAKAPPKAKNAKGKGKADDQDDPDESHGDDAPAPKAAPKPRGKGQGKKKPGSDDADGDAAPALPKRQRKAPANDETGEKPPTKRRAKKSKETVEETSPVDDDINMAPPVASSSKAVNSRKRKADAPSSEAPGRKRRAVSAPPAPTPPPSTPSVSRPGSPPETPPRMSGPKAVRELLLRSIGTEYGGPEEPIFGPTSQDMGGPENIFDGADLFTPMAGPSKRQRSPEAPSSSLTALPPTSPVTAPITVAPEVRPRRSPRQLTKPDPVPRAGKQPATRKAPAKQGKAKAGAKAEKLTLANLGQLVKQAPHLNETTRSRSRSRCQTNF
jgi:hypothetical protein